GADASSAHLRGSTDGSYYRGQQQGAGGQLGYGLDPRYPRVHQSPRGPTGYPDPMVAGGGGMYAEQQQQQQQTPASPMLASRRLP
ncbi:unnamed protein product, partial [Ectocarpus sp. 12 AP-2014]